MDDSHPFCSMPLGRPIPEKKLFQTLTLKFQLQGQGHGCGQRARSYNRPSIILTHFIFISHQSHQQFLRKSYFEIWPWNIQGQGHEWGLRSRSHIVLSIQPMHFLFVSHQSDLPFLRYGQNSVWPWKNTSEILRDMAKIVWPWKKNIRNFYRKFAQIKVSNRTSPKSNQVITMTGAIKLPCFVVIQWVVLTLLRKQAIFF